MPKQSNKYHWSFFNPRCKKNTPGYYPDNYQNHYSTFEELARIYEKPETVTSKGQRSFFGGKYLPGAKTRGLEGVQYRSFLTFDLEKNMKKGSFDEIKKILEGMNTNYILHSTYNHRPDNCRYRILIPLKEPISNRSEFEAVSRSVLNQHFLEYSESLGGIVDDSCHQFSRFMYTPETAPGHESEYLYAAQLKKEPLDASEVRIEKKTEPISNESGKAPAPEKAYKSNHAGLFNQAFTIEQAIDRFELPYEKSQKPNRYTYIHGSGKDGLEIKNEAWAYSAHDTDPAGKDSDGIRHYVNAYDLVFAHLFTEDYQKEKQNHQPMIELMKTLPEIDQNRLRQLKPKDAPDIDFEEYGGQKIPSTAFRPLKSIFDEFADFELSIADPSFTAIPTGFEELDKQLDGGLYPGLYFIGAVSSLGKTTLTLQIADQIAKSGRDVMFFSLEMARDEVIAKSISRISAEINGSEDGPQAVDFNPYGSLEANSILSPNKRDAFSPNQRTLYQMASYEYKTKTGKNLFIIPGLGEMNVNMIDGYVSHLIADQKAKDLECRPVVFVDYLQVLRPLDVRMSDKQAVDQNVLRLKQISTKYKIPVVVVSSFNRNSYNEPVSTESFKESGLIEYTADVLIGLQYEGMDYELNLQTSEYETKEKHKTRVKKLVDRIKADGWQGYSQPIQIKVLKNRRFATGSSSIEMYPKYNLFREPVKSHRASDTGKLEMINRLMNR